MPRQKKPRADSDGEEALLGLPKGQVALAAGRLFCRLVNGVACYDLRK